MQRAGEGRKEYRRGGLDMYRDHCVTLANQRPHSSSPRSVLHWLRLIGSRRQLSMAAGRGREAARGGMAGAVWPALSTRAKAMPPAR